MTATIGTVLERFKDDSIDLTLQKVEEYTIIRGTKRDFEFLATLLLAHAYSTDPEGKVMILDPNIEGQSFINQPSSNTALALFRDDPQ